MASRSVKSSSFCLRKASVCVLANFAASSRISNFPVLSSHSAYIFSFSASISATFVLAVTSTRSASLWILTNSAFNFVLSAAKLLLFSLSLSVRVVTWDFNFLIAISSLSFSAVIADMFCLDTKSSAYPLSWDFSSSSSTFFFSNIIILSWFL